MTLSKLVLLVLLTTLAALSVVHAETPGCKSVFSLERAGDRAPSQIDAIEFCPAKPGKVQRLRVRAVSAQWIELDVTKAEWQRLEARVRADLKQIATAPKFTADCPARQQLSLTQATRATLVCEPAAGPLSERIARLQLAARQLYFPPNR